MYAKREVSVVCQRERDGRCMSNAHEHNVDFVVPPEEIPRKRRSCNHSLAGDHELMRAN